MANPLDSYGTSPLMTQLLRRHLSPPNGLTTPTQKFPTENLTPTVPNVRMPNLRPRRFVSTHLRTVLQPKKML